MRRLPIALTLATAFAAGCGPVKIDVGGVVVTSSPKASRAPGDGPSASPDGSPAPEGTLEPNATPTPAANDTPSPDATPTPGNPQGASPGPSPTPGGPSPTPTPTGATPTPAPQVGNASIKSFALAGPFKPVGVGVDSQGNAWVGMGNLGSSTSSDVSHLVKLGPDGSSLKSVELPGAVSAVVVDKQDNAWALHYAKSQFGQAAGAVSKVSASGELLSTQVLGGPEQQPATLVLDAQGNLWTLEQQGKVDKLSANGGLLGSYATGTASYQTYGLGVDATGQAWVGSSGDKNLIKLTTTGTVSDSLKVAGLSAIYSVGVDVNGTIWAGGSTGASTTQISCLDGTGKLVNSFTVGSYIRQFLPSADQKMWVLTSTQAGGGSVTKMTTKGESLDSYPAGDMPQAFGLGGDGSIWVANPSSGKVTRILPPQP